MRRGFLLLGVIGVLAFANTAYAVAPTLGAYQGIIDGTPNTNGHNEGEGLFCLKQSPTGTIKITAGKCGGYQLTAITMPSYFQCNAVNARLPKSSLKVINGSFHFKGIAPIGPGLADRNIKVTGTWVSPSQAKGTTRIWTLPGDPTPCDSGTLPWTMNTPPA